MMVKSNALKNFGKDASKTEIEAPPSVKSRSFNECDIIGNLDRDEKGNVIAEQDA